MATSKKATAKKETAKKEQSGDINLTFDRLPEESNPEVAKGRVEKYTVKENEQSVVHVELETTTFNMATGKKTSFAQVSKMNPVAWSSFRKVCKMSGWKHVRVLFAPEGVDTTVLESGKLPGTSA